MRLVFYIVSVLLALLAITVLWRGESVLMITSQLWHYLGPVFSLVFGVLLFWGGLCLLRLRQGHESARQRLELVVMLARESGLVGTLMGILAVASQLLMADFSSPQSLLQAIPNVLNGLILALGTSLAGRVIATFFVVSGELLPVSCQTKESVSCCE